jgi:uncharacterized repeat protein (TIGR03803 family)
MCTVAANQAGNAAYGPAPKKTESFAITKARSTIRFDAAPALVVGGTETIPVTGGDANQPVTVSSLTPGICTTGGTYGLTVTGIAVGTCTLVADQAGGSDTATVTVAVLPLLHSFSGGWRDGAYPRGELVADAEGALYGTSVAGGRDGLGTVYKLVPPAPGQPRWTEVVLHSFSSETRGEGAAPAAGLVRDGTGALYGTTALGGGSGVGTVFKLTRPAGNRTAWTLAVLHSFRGATEHGAHPQAGVTFGRDGGLYGTTVGGGDHNLGTVFKLTPSPGPGFWAYTVLHSFAGGGADGAAPEAGVIADDTGALYGTTRGGGKDDAGTVFRLTPPAGGNSWTETLLHSFAGSFARPADGVAPGGGLIRDGGGRLYGTTRAGGPFALGTVFRLVPPVGYDTGWRLECLHSFAGGRDGALPRAGLSLDAGTGALYGTTERGGGDDAGVVFKLTPPAQPGMTWTETTLYRFGGEASGDGSGPWASLIRETDGALYGTTERGGTYGAGTVFRLEPELRSGAE